MADKRIKNTIKGLSNEKLIETINKIRKEKANPQIYGKDGTSRYDTFSEFWRGYHGTLRSELERRKKLGKISKNAGVPVKNAVKHQMGYSIDEIMRM